MTLRESFKDWTDWDVAEYRLAMSLGLMWPGVDFTSQAKHVFWSNNPIDNALDACLTQHVHAGVLEFDEEEQRVGWSPGFRGSWESDRYPIDSDS